MNRRVTIHRSANARDRNSWPDLFVASFNFTTIGTCRNASESRQLEGPHRRRRGERARRARRKQAVVGVHRENRKQLHSP